MELILERIHNTSTSTIGKLFIDGTFQCNTLEDVDRDLLQTDSLDKIKSVKVYGKTAIPKGKYEVQVTFSNRFQKNLPLLINVPGFEGIRIHPGNTSEDTDGCILPGKWVEENVVQDSRVNFEPVFSKIQNGLKSGKVYITIK